MTWDTAKLIRGKAFVQEVEIAIDACKYSVAPYSTNNTIAAGSAYTDSHTGGVTLNATYATEATTWGEGTIYLRHQISGEIIEAESFNEFSGGSIIFVTRGMFGTIPAAILSGHIFTILHQGEADGSCRGYPHDCSNGDSYSATAKLRPIFATAPSRAGELRFPGLRSVRYDDGEVDIGETIGSRASLSFDISDYRNNDYFFVPYQDKRSENGTLWGKLLARHPYLEGREVKYREGYRDPYSLDEPEWIERTLIVDSYKLSDEKLSVKCLDPLTLTEDKKAKMPVASPARLLSNLTAGSTFNYYDAPDYYFGAMSATILVRIDSEVIVCTVSGATELTVVTRGYRSIQKDHEAGATIQDCIRFTNTHIVDAIVYALENFTVVPSAYINSAAYDDIKDLMPTAILDDAIITKPIAVVDFINDLLKIGNLGLYFDTVESEIVMIYVPVQEIQPISIDEQNHIKRDSVSIDDNTKNQFTRFSAMWGLTDITSDSEEKYAIRYMSINVDLESDGLLGQVNERKLQKLPLLTTSVDDSLLGAAYTARIINENQEKPKIVSIDLDASQVGLTQSGELKKGSIISLSTKYNQDKDGNNLSELFQVRKVSGDGFDGYTIKMKKFQFLVSEDIDFEVTGNHTHYDLSDDYAPTAGHYIIYIGSGVEIGSTDPDIPAFTTGTQDPGVTFTIINAGKILSIGGNGGNFGSPATDGTNGGLCFSATVDCEIQTAAGLIWAGGGGGGGSVPFAYAGPFGPTYYTAASGGSGGQGSGVSFGGDYTLGGLSASVDGQELDGNVSSAGNSGNRGGDFGENGENGEGPPASAGVGGLAGIAIQKNGNTVTITSGNNDLNVRGRIEA